MDQMRHCRFATINIKHTKRESPILLYIDNIYQSIPILFILKHVISCVTFCSAFEVALRGQDKTEHCENYEVFYKLSIFLQLVNHIDTYYHEIIYRFQNSLHIITYIIIILCCKIQEN